MKTITIKKPDPRSQGVVKYWVEKGDLLMKEKDMRYVAKKAGVKVRRVVAPYVGMIGYELSGTNRAIKAVARGCIEWVR